LNYIKGWVECVGCADRSAYDLSQHTKSTGVRLVAERKLREPKTIDVVEAVANKGIVGKSFKKEAKEIMEALSKLEPSTVAEVEESLKNNGKYVLEIGANSYVLTPDMLEVKRYQKTIYVEEYVPNVIEPSFGIGRIMYSIFEHNFKVRSDGGQRTVSTKPPDGCRHFRIFLIFILFFCVGDFLSISLYLRLSLH
jgi:glycyl-tRNA synthetase